MDGTNEDINQPNGSIMVISSIMQKIMSSAAEVECGELFYNSKELEALRTTLKEMGHQQQATEIITDNSTSNGIMRVTIKQKRTKSMDVRFYWFRDQVEQKHLEVKCKPGHINLCDYFTRHPP